MNTCNLRTKSSPEQQWLQSLQVKRFLVALVVVVVTVAVIVVSDKEQNIAYGECGLCGQVRFDLSDLAPT